MKKYNINQIEYDDLQYRHKIVNTTDFHIELIDNTEMYRGYWTLELGRHNIIDLEKKDKRKFTFITTNNDYFIGYGTFDNQLYNLVIFGSGELVQLGSKFPHPIS